MDLLGRKTLKMSMEYTHRIGCLPDIHAGESRAVMTDDFETDEGQKISPNPAQKLIKKQWDKTIEMYDKLKVQYIFVVGDAFGGINRIESGRYMFCRIPDQIRLAADLLEPVCKNRKLLVWRGTQYHEYPKGVGEAHLELVNRLRGRGVDAEFMGAHSYIELVGPKRTRRLFVAHEAPTGLVYPATLMSRDIMWATMGGGDKTLEVDGIVRAHLHHWLHVDHSGKHAVQLPCWLAHTPYKQTIKYFFKLQPTIGGTVIVMDSKGRLDFWGGSPPFCMGREERIALHRETVKIKPLDPLEKSGVFLRHLRR